MLVLDEFNRWGGDVQDDFQMTLGENISILLPTDHVILDQDITFRIPDVAGFLLILFLLYVGCG